MRTLIFEQGLAREDSSPNFPALIASDKLVFWVDIPAHNAMDRAMLRDVFHMHPLAVEHVGLRMQRPVVEDYTAHLFAIMITAMFNRRTLEFHDINVFIGRNYIITVHHRRDLFVEGAMNRLLKVTEPAIHITPGYLFYEMVDSIVDGYFPLLSSLGDAIEDLEDEILRLPESAQLSRLVELKRNLREMRRLIWPQQDIFQAMLASKKLRFMNDRSLDVYFRDVYDKMQRVVDLINTYRDSLTAVLDLYLSMASNRLGKVINRLTVLTLVIGALTVVGGFYGMNFETTWPPFGDPSGILFAVMLMVGIVLIGLVVMRRID